MPGYERDRFVGLSTNDLDEFTCGICLQILRSPVVVPCCRHTYCQSCITQWLSSGNESCPNDRQALIVGQLYDTQRLVTNLMAKLRIRCDYHLNGCQSVQELHRLDEHSSVCLYNPNRRCPDCGLQVFDSVQQELVVFGVKQHNCVNSLKQLNTLLAEEVQQLKADVLKHMNEIKTLTDGTDNHNNNFVTNNQTDHTDRVLATARRQLKHPEITYCSMASTLRLKAIQKSKEAIARYKTYTEITQFLSQQFNECPDSSSGSNVHKWHIMAGSLHNSTLVMVTSNMGWIDLRFGQLKITIFTAQNSG